MTGPGAVPDVQTPGVVSAAAVAQAVSGELPTRGWTDGG